MISNKYYIVLFFLGFFLMQIQAQDANTIKSVASPFPDRVMLTIPGNPSSSRAVSWRTSFVVKEGYGQIIEAIDAPDFDSLATTIKGESKAWEQGSELGMGHRVLFEGLSPNTLYNYRVGDTTGWSEWFQFKTASEGAEPFSFLYFGDVQNGIKDFGSRIIREAFRKDPYASFMLFAGDLVNRSYEFYWDEFFYAGSFIFGTIPTIATPGNHEYYPNVDTTLPREFSKHWDQIFTFPQNGPEKNLNKSYFVDYQGVRMISIDSYFLSTITNNEDDYMSWLESALKGSTGNWTMVFFHHPIYSCSYGRDNVKIRTLLKPLFEKYGVDLVLQGHDHSYCRGQNLEHVGDDCENAPMYVVSVSGSKMYGLSLQKWADRVGSLLQLYQVVEVNGDSITLNSYTVTGKIYDSFQLVKQADGTNKIIENPIYLEYDRSIQIPEKYKSRYSNEELDKYQEVYD